MLKYILLSTLVISLMLLTVSCEICELSEEKRLSEQQKEQNPFQGFETIKYSIDDSIVQFTGTGRSNFVEEYNISINSCDWGVVEYDKMNFRGESREIKIEMYGRNNFQIYYNDSIQDIYLFSWFYVENSPANNSAYEEFIDSLIVGDETYFNIFKDSLSRNPTSEVFPDSLIHPIFLYYSTEFGIVKFDFSDGSVWELQEIIW